MSARDDLMHEVISGLLSGDFRYSGDAGADASELIDAFAHELAEKIRRDADWDETHGEKYRNIEGKRDAADLIDPEVEK